MDKAQALTVINELLLEVPDLKKLPFGNEEYSLWLSKARTVIKEGLDQDDLKSFCSYRPVHTRGLFGNSVYQADYLGQLQDYAVALKSIIQKYELISQAGTQVKPEFSNNTIGCIVELLSDKTDSELRTFFLKFGLLEIYIQSGNLTSKQRKISDTFQHLVSERKYKVIGEIIRLSIKDLWTRKKNRLVVFEDIFPQDFRELYRSLLSDGYQVVEGELVPIISPCIDPAKEESLLDSLLSKYHFEVAKNHLKQAYANYSGGNWESSNAALRSFLQEIFDAIALLKFTKEGSDLEPGGKRRQLLQAKGFIDGATEADLVKSFFTFAGTDGSHPGISSESDSRLRRYIAVAVASYYLEKLERLNGQT